MIEENKYIEILEKYKNENSMDIASVNKILDRMLLEFNILKDIPDIILTRALYVDEVTGVLNKGKFVIRPSIKYNLKIKDMKKSFIVIKTDKFYEEIVKVIIDWIDEYREYMQLQIKLEKLNYIVLGIIKETDFPYKINFTLGEGITDISDESIDLGLSVETIKNIENLGFFDKDEDYRNRYIESFKTILKDCNRPYDIVKVKSEITKELGIYNRKSINKLLRKIVSRRIDYVRVGIGYVETVDTFALIEKIAISEDDIFKYEKNKNIIIDNENPSVIEKKKGLNKIVIKYKLMPFEKRTNILLDIDVKKYLDGVKIYEEMSKECKE